MSERNFTIVLLVVMGVALVAGAIAIYILRFQTLAERKDELAQVTRSVNDAQEKQKNIPKLREKVEGLEDKIGRIRAQIPVFNFKDENDQFANLVDQLRKKTRVMISGARYTPARSAGPGEQPLPPTIFRARYEFKVGGGFYQLLSFLNLLESENRFLVADNIKFSAGNASDRGPVVREMQMNLSTFLQRPQAPPPGAVGVKPTDKPVEAPPEETKRLSTPIPD